jgi:ADP-heptose:LPS heptosyltransferase
MPQNNILIIKLGALGDFVQALGPMKAIRAHHPDAHITLLTTKPFVKLAEKSGVTNDIWLDERPKWHNLSGWMNLRCKLNGGHFARVYDLQNNDRTGFYFKLFSPRPEWVGIAPGASHRNTSPQRTAGLAFDGHVQTLGLAGVNNITVDKMEWIDGDLSHLGLRPPYILIVPGSAPSRPEKRWPASSYAALCNTLAARGYQPVLVGTKDEKETISAIANDCPAALDIAGQTSLLDIAVLARGAAGAVGNDTGPMHMIAPTGCPTLVLFSRFSNPVRHAPKGDALSYTQTNDLAALSADDVFIKLEKMLR